mgnify:CR=1 FL=1
MHKLYIKKTQITPEINFDPDTNTYIIEGVSAPEDVRALYYPVIEWLNIFIEDILEGEYNKFNQQNPFRLKIDLSYFNSSSAKFLYDILLELIKLKTNEIPFVVEWLYDEEDIDMKEAGTDISRLAEVEFEFTSKLKH